LPYFCGLFNKRTFAVNFIMQGLQTTRANVSRLPEIDFDHLPFGSMFADHMFVCDYRDGKWCDSRILPYQPLALSPATSALHYGQSIFEGLKAFRQINGQSVVFRPEDNHKRMNRSAERLCMPAIGKEFFMDGLMELLRTDEAWIPRPRGFSLYVRPFMFATDEYVGIRPSENYSFIIFCCLVGRYYQSAIHVKVSDDYVRAFPRGTGYAKVAGNYAAGMMPLKLAQQQGFDQLVWLDGREMKYVEESGTMNLFFQFDQTLVTPIADGTILEGITRDSVIRMAKDAGFKVEVRKISIEEVFEAYNHGRLRDMFGTGTAATIAPISSVTYKGFCMELRPTGEREMSLYLSKHLEQIRTGEIADPYGWNVPVMP